MNDAENLRDIDETRYGPNMAFLVADHFLRSWILVQFTR